MSYNKDPKFWDLKLSLYSLEFSLSVVTFFKSTLILLTKPFEFIRGTELYFNIGDGISDRAKVLVASDIEGVISKDWKWPLDVVLRILRLGDNANIVLSINSKGLLQIIVDSGIGAYTYLLPAKN